jgi:hypothetical protein
MLIAAVGTFVIATGRVEMGLALLIGSLPAAVTRLAPTRKQRFQTVIIGSLFGIMVLLGSFIAQWAVVAVVGIFLLALTASMLAAHKPRGMLALTLCVPLAGVGLSYSGVEDSFGLAMLMIAGSVTVYGWSLLFPEHDAPGQSSAPLLSEPQAREYGVRVGLTGSTATAIGFLSGADHVGWITAASLFVIRPSKELQTLRSIGRAVSVFAGALLASWMLKLHMTSLAIAIVAAGALIIAAATHASRWYVTPAFTTFLVFWLMLYSQPTTHTIEYRFWQRVLDTALGVAIAYFFGLLVPKLLAQRAARYD